MSINDNVKFFENIKYKIKYIQHFTTLIDCFFFLSKMVMRIIQEILLMSVTCHLVEIRKFNGLFFDQSVKNKQEAMNNLLKCQEIMIIQQEIH